MRFLVIGEENSGKTSVGIELSKKLNLPFFDQDDLLHTTLCFPQLRQYTPIQYKEKKNLEHSIISQLLRLQKQFVLSTGSGFLNGYYEDEELLKRVVSITIVICLKKQEYSQREDYSNVVIAVDNKSINEIVNEIMERIF